MIQYNISAKGNLIEHGFIDKDRSDERARNPDFRVLVALGFDKATDKVLGQAKVRGQGLARLFRRNGCVQAYRRNCGARERRYHKGRR